MYSWFQRSLANLIPIFLLYAYHPPHQVADPDFFGTVSIDSASFGGDVTDSSANFATSMEGKVVFSIVGVCCALFASRRYRAKKGTSSKLLQRREDTKSISSSK